MIVVYSKPNCSYCDATKMWLTINGFAFTDVDIMQDQVSLDMLKSHGHKSAPQIYRDDGSILVPGGYNGLIALGVEGLKLRLAECRSL